MSSWPVLMFQRISCYFQYRNSTMQDEHLDPLSDQYVEPECPIKYSEKS